MQKKKKKLHQLLSDVGAAGTTSAPKAQYRTVQSPFSDIQQVPGPSPQDPATDQV